MVKGHYVIDSHCHVYPDKIAERAVAGTGNFYNVKFACDGRESTLRRVAAEAGIDHCVIQSVATSPHQVKSINEFIARTVEEGGGVFTGLGTLHPDSEDMKGDVLHLMDLGLRGVKLHPDIQAFKIDDYRCLRIYELCEEYGLPILMHTGDKRYDYSNPNRLKPILEIYTGLKVIGAHLGGWSIYEQASEELKGIPNLWFDCSSTFYWLDKNKAKEIIYKLGTDRVLFGTDYPMWEPKRELDTFLSLGFSPEDEERILSLNAKALFGIK